MCYYIIQISLRLYVILTIASFPGSTSKDLGGGASVLYLALLRLLTAPAPRNGRLDFHHVTVSRGHGARALECALLCRALRDRPGMRGQDAYGLQWADIARVLSVALSYVASSLAHARPRIRESLTPRVYVASRSNAISHVV